MNEERSTIITGHIWPPRLSHHITGLARVRWPHACPTGFPFSTTLQLASKLFMDFLWKVLPSISCLQSGWTSLLEDSLGPPTHRQFTCWFTALMLTNSQECDYKRAKSDPFPWKGIWWVTPSPVIALHTEHRPTFNASAGSPLCCVLYSQSLHHHGLLSLTSMSAKSHSSLKHPLVTSSNAACWQPSACLLWIRLRSGLAVRK